MSEQPSAEPLSQEVSFSVRPKLEFDTSNAELMIDLGLSASSIDAQHPAGHVTARCAAVCKPYSRSVSGRASFLKNYYLGDPYVEGSACVSAGAARVVVASWPSDMRWSLQRVLQ